MKRKAKRKEIDRLIGAVTQLLVDVEDRIDFLIENKDFLVEVPAESGRLNPLLGDLMEEAQMYLFYLEYLENAKESLE